MFQNKLVPIKPLLMVLTAALSTITGATALSTVMSNSGLNHDGFLLTANPSYLTLEQGASAQSTITLVSLQGFAGTVALSTSFLAGSLPVSLNPASLTVQANGIAASTLIVSAPANATITSYDIVVTGTKVGSGKTISASTLLTVQVTSNRDFALKASPSSITNVQGSTNTSTITLTSLNGFTGTVALNVTVPFAFITVMGGQSPVTLSAGGIATTTLQISTTASTLPGTYIIVVAGTSGKLAHSIAIPVTVVTATTPAITSLVLVSYSFSSNTNLTLYLKNAGSTSATLTSYVVRDTAGNAWTAANWQGPVIAPGSVVPANILIWTSCSSCIYTGVFGSFTQFVTGQSYTVTITTSTNAQFSFTVTR